MVVVAFGAPETPVVCKASGTPGAPTETPPETWAFAGLGVKDRIGNSHRTAAAARAGSFWRPLSQSNQVPLIVISSLVRSTLTLSTSSRRALTRLIGTCAGHGSTRFLCKACDSGRRRF